MKPSPIILSLLLLSGCSKTKESPDKITQKTEDKSYVTYTNASPDPQAVEIYCDPHPSHFILTRDQDECIRLIVREEIDNYLKSLPRSTVTPFESVNHYQDEQKD